MKKSLSTEKSELDVLFFDGVCSLCNRFVDFLIRNDARDLYFASLQSSYARARGVVAGETVVLLSEGELYVESAAALRAIARVGGVYKLALVFLVVPAFVRDFVYRWVSRNRYRWFGKRETCRLPTPAERERILG